MNVEFQNTKEDYKKFFKIQFVGEIRKRILFVILISFGLALACITQSFSLSKFLFAFIWGISVLSFTFYLIPFITAIVLINKKISADKKFTEKKKIVSNDDGIDIQYQDETKKIIWQSIYTCYSNMDYINIIFVDNSSLLIPKRFFQSQTDALNFQGIVESGIVKIKGLGSITRKQPLVVPGKIDYTWIIIGSIILLVLVGVYFLYKAGEGIGKDLKKTNFMGTICQEYLNSDVKAIELYKLKHGVYPDSLQQIDTNFFAGGAIIYEPFPFIQNPKVKQRAFNYKKAGEKYYLFSSGPDRKPNTSDDIYPSYTDTKFGLIRKNE
ncbi:MAG: hypothetical protein HY063_03715 [Bacteroidetes bacterium]|nr:hypothetical protein [Bacteroidota bacterium]